MGEACRVGVRATGVVGVNRPILATCAGWKEDSIPAGSTGAAADVVAAMEETGVVGVAAVVIELLVAKGGEIDLITGMSRIFQSGPTDKP